MTQAPKSWFKSYNTDVGQVIVHIDAIRENGNPAVSVRWMKDHKLALSASFGFDNLGQAIAQYERIGIKWIKNFVDGPISKLHDELNEKIAMQEDDDVR